MKENVWERLIDRWAMAYYTPLFWFVSMIIAIFMGVKFYRKEKLYFFFMVYSISGLILFFGLYVLEKASNIHGRPGTILAETGNTLFALIEITTFYLFYRKIIIIRPIRPILNAFLVLYYVLSIVFFAKITDPGFSEYKITSFSFHINVIEFFFLLFLCLIYFFQLFTKEVMLLKPLSKIPAFWITTGLFFYIVISLPFLLIGDKLYINYHSIYYIMFSIHYTSISFLFLCLAKAFSCKTTLTI